MKYFKAIGFTMLMVLLFFGTVVFVQGVDAAQKLAKVINNAIEEENYHLMLRGNYQSSDPIIDLIYEDETITMLIKGYETITINEENKVINNFELLIVVTEGRLFNNTDVKIISSLEEDLELGEESSIPDVWLLKYLNLEVYTLVASYEGDKLLQIDKVFSEDDIIFESLLLSYVDIDTKTEEELYNYLIPFNLRKSDLTFNETLTTYYNANNFTYPTSDTATIRIPQDVHISTTNSIVIAGSVSIVLILLFTYYVYSVRPKRRLGKAKPTTHLQKDLDKVIERQIKEKKEENKRTK